MTFTFHSPACLLWGMVWVIIPNSLVPPCNRITLHTSHMTLYFLPLKGWDMSPPATRLSWAVCTRPWTKAATTPGRSTSAVHCRPVPHLFATCGACSNVHGVQGEPATGGEDGTCPSAWGQTLGARLYPTCW